MSSLNTTLDPIAQFGHDSTAAIMATVTSYPPEQQVGVLHEALNSLDPKLWSRVVARSGSILATEAGLKNIDAIESALKKEMSNHLLNVFKKLGSGDLRGYEDLGFSITDIVTTPAKFIGGVASNVVPGIGGLVCKVAGSPIGAVAAGAAGGPAAAAGATVAGQLLCGSGSNGSLTPEQIALIQLQQQQAEQQRTMMYVVGGAIGIALLAVVLS